MSRRKVVLQRALPALVSVGVLVWLFWNVDLEALVGIMSWRVAAVMLPALVAYGAATLLLEALSITRLVDASGDALGAWTAARIKCASYLLGIVNYALGAAALTVLLRRRTRLSLGAAASLVILVSSTDLAVVLLTMGGVAALVETRAPTVQAGVVVALMFVLFGGLVVLRAPRSLGPLDRIRSLTIFEGMRNVPLERLALLLALRACFVASFIGLGAASFFAFGIWPPMVEQVLGILFVGFIAGLPIAVAGLGTSQAAFLFIFADHASQEALLAQSLALSTGMLALRALMGLVFAREFTGEALRETRSAEA